MNGKRFLFTLLMISLALLPRDSVQAAAARRPNTDPLPEHPVRDILGQSPQSGVNYDSASLTWYFYGVPIERVRYEIPGAGIDLVQLLFLSRSGVPYKVWVAVGMDWGAEYLPLGPWVTAEQVQAIRLDETLLKVNISETKGTLHPQVDESGVRWTNCLPESACEYGRFLDTMHNDLSNLFIDYEIAPGWYPWGFLFWDVEIVAQYKRNPTINLSMESRVR